MVKEMDLVKREVILKEKQQKQQKKKKDKKLKRKKNHMVMIMKMQGVAEMAIKEMIWLTNQ